MSTPADRHPLDPISQALGHLEGRFDQFEKQVADRFTSIEKRIATLRSEMRTLIGGLYVLLAAGLTVVGWLITRTH
jgi:hypothetical protein